MIRFLGGTLVKLTMSYVFWVFVLSLRWQGQTLYDYSHQVLVENSLVEIVEDHLGDLWHEVNEVVSDSYARYKLKSESDRSL